MRGRLLYPSFKIAIAMERANGAQTLANLSPSGAARNPFGYHIKKFAEICHCQPYGNFCSWNDLLPYFQLSHLKYHKILANTYFFS